MIYLECTGLEAADADCLIISKGGAHTVSVGTHSNEREVEHGHSLAVDGEDVGGDGL